MDPSSSSTGNENTKKRPVSSEEEAQEVQEGSKRSFPNSSDPLPTGCSGFLTPRCLKVTLTIEFGPENPQEETIRLDSLPPLQSYGPEINLLQSVVGIFGESLKGIVVNKEPTVGKKHLQQVIKDLNKNLNELVQSLQSVPQTVSTNSNQHERGSGSGTLEIGLRFCNKIANVMYHNDVIKAIDGNQLKFEYFAADPNTTIPTGQLSSARFQILLLEQENSSKRDPICVSADKQRELISFKFHEEHRLENGIGYVKDLIVNPNTYWISKKFYLAVKIVDEEILMEGSVTIEDAMSGAFIVKTNRMKGFKKHNPPRKESEVWRLDGISKRGVYCTNLYEKAGITNVGDFLKIYHELDFTGLKKIFGDKMTEERLEKIFGHAKQCVGYDPTHYPQILQADDHHADTNHNSEVHNPQNQSSEDNNNNMAGTAQVANSNHDSAVHNYQNPSVKDDNNNFVTTEQLAHFEVHNYQNQSVEDDNNNLAGTQQLANSNHNLEVHNHQFQSVEDDNNNFVGIEQLANSNHNCEVYVDQNQNVETNHFEYGEVEANGSYQNFEVPQQSQNLHEEKNYGHSGYEEWSLEQVFPEIS